MLLALLHNRRVDHCTSRCASVGSYALESRSSRSRDRAAALSHRCRAEADGVIDIAEVSSIDNPAPPQTPPCPTLQLRPTVPPLRRFQRPATPIRIFRRSGSGSTQPTAESHADRLPVGTEAGYARAFDLAHIHWHGMPTTESSFVTAVGAMRRACGALRKPGEECLAGLAPCVHARSSSTPRLSHLATVPLGPVPLSPARSASQHH